MSIQKCPKCKAELSSSATICEWCNTVLNREGDDSVENITLKLTEIIKSARKIPQKGLFSSLTKNAKVSMPAFAIIAFILAYKINAWFIIAGLIFSVYAFISLFKKTEDYSPVLRDIQAEFEAEINRLYSLYGANDTVSSQIKSYMADWNLITKSSEQSKKMEWTSYAIILSVLGMVLIIPNPKSSAELKAETLQGEQSVVSEVEKLIEANDFKAAEQLLPNIISLENSTRIRSTLQLKQCNNKLDIANQCIANQKYADARTVLQQVKWKKYSVEYDGEIIEEPFFKQFVSRKNEIMSTLPEEYTIEKEDEYNF
jgi:hypothetical protein